MWKLCTQVISLAFYLGNGNSESDLCEVTSVKNHYLAGVKKNLEKIRVFYPDYSMRVYHDAPLNSRFAKDIQTLALFCLLWW